MKKSQKQAEPDPDKEALEERVRQMMDPTIEETSIEPSQPDSAPLVQKTPESTDPKDVLAASEPPKPKASKKKIAIVHAEDSSVEPAVAASELPDETPDGGEVEPEDTVPGPPPLVKARKVAIVQTEPEEAATSQSPAETAPEVSPETPVPETETDDKTAFQKAALEATAQDPLFRAQPLEADNSDLELPPLPDDPATNRAVEDIIIREGDKLLEVQDKVVEPEVAQAFAEPRPSLLGRLLRRKSFRRVVLLLVFGTIVAVAAVPPARYYTLNQLGVRSAASLVVLDDSTQQPLKNVTVTVAGVAAKTGSDGKASFERLPLGPARVAIEKRAFATAEFEHTFGWGSNPLGEYGLTPTGARYTFTLTDFVSGQPVEGAEANSADASAVSDKDGKLVLTREDSEDAEFEIEVSKDKYRSEKLVVPADETAETAIKLVLARKHVYITKQAGRFDVMQGDIDGTNEVRLLAGTGSERDDMVVVSHPTDEFAGLVSTRDNKRNQDGFLLSSLTIFNLGESTSKVITTSERVHIVGWLGDRIVYVQVAAGESASSPKRHRLVSYDFRKQETTELASSNFFNDILVTGGKIFYAPSSAYQDNPQTGLFRVNADGSDRQIVVGKEVWNMFRVSHDQLQIAGPAEWYSYNIGSSGIAMRLDPAPANPVNRLYVDSPDGKHSLWSEMRDGKGTLLFYDVAGRSDSVLRSQPGLKYPVRWLDDSTIVFRIATTDETADYVMSTKTTDVKKIRDVTNTGGVDRWYYY